MRALTIATWAAAAVLLGGAVVGGAGVLGGADQSLLSVVLAFAGGAVLASLADTLFPKAYEHGWPWVAFATVAGFLTSFLLGLV